MPTDLTWTFLGLSTNPSVSRESDEGLEGFPSTLAAASSPTIAWDDQTAREELVSTLPTYALGVLAGLDVTRITAARSGSVRRRRNVFGGRLRPRGHLRDPV